MDISVIIPTYRPKDYLWECLDSLAVQTLPKEKFEVIIVLNGCKDPYYMQISDYAIQHADNLNIRLIHTRENGVSNARNIGLDNAEGRFIAFIDDDDYISPTYLEEMSAKAADETIVACDTYYFKDGCTERQYSRMSEVFHNLSPEGKTDYINARRLFFCACMKLIPAKSIADRRFDTSMTVGEDGLFMFSISDKYTFVDFTSDKAVYYRRLRKDSVFLSHSASSRMTILRNDLKMIWKYTALYFSGIFRYSFFFYLTRIRGSIHI